MLCSKLTYTKVYLYSLERSVILTIYVIGMLLLQSGATVGYQQTLKITKDGSVSDPSKLPRCSDGARINLLSYSILNGDCFSNTNCEDQLSGAQQLYIHQHCSLKESCKAMDFPTNDDRSGVDRENFFLKVKYECLDHFTEFLDICDNISKPIYNTVHLLSTQSYQTMGECHCSLKDGHFSLVLNDIRLLSIEGQSCSNSELQIGNHTFNCSNGLLFNRIFSEQPMTSVGIKLRNTRSHGILPQMTWLIIKPNDSLRIICRSSVRPHKTSVAVYHSPSTNSTSTLSDVDGSPISPAIYVVPIAIGIIVVAAAVACLILRKRIRRQSKPKRPDRSKSTDESLMQKLNTTGATIADVEPSEKTTRKDINEEIEMIKTQGYTDNDRNEAECVKMDDVSGSVVSEIREGEYGLKVTPGQKDTFYNHEPEYKTDREHQLGYMMDISV